VKAIDWGITPLDIDAVVPLAVYGWLEAVVVRFVTTLVVDVANDERQVDTGNGTKANNFLIVNDPTYPVPEERPAGARTSELYFSWNRTTA